MSFRAPRSGNITSFRTYLQAGSGGYAAGTGGRMQARIWPADNGTPARPIRTGTPLSTGSVQLNLIGGNRTALSDSWPLFALTANGSVTAGQMYFIEIQNIDPSPTVNWVSVNAQCAIDRHVTVVRHTPVPDWVMIWEVSSGSSSTYIDASTQHSSSLAGSLYYFPSAEYGYSDGTYFGFIRLEPGNYSSYPYVVNSSSPVRERFNITEDTIITGVEIHASAQTAGDLAITCKKNGATVATTLIHQATANFTTSSPNGNGVYSWYSLDLPTDQRFSVAAGDVLDIEMVAVGSSVWRMSADRTGVDADLGLSAASTYATSSAQKWNGSSWINTLYYSQLCSSCRFATSHFRVILKAGSGTALAAPTNLRIIG